MGTMSVDYPIMKKDNVALATRRYEDKTEDFRIGEI